MRHALWLSWSRMSGVLFPLTAAALFFTPQESNWGVSLSMAAIASGGTWIYLRSKQE